MQEANSALGSIDIQSLMSQGSSLLMLYLPKVLLAIVTLLIGLWIIKIFGKVVQKSLGKGNVDVSLRRFIGSIVVVTLKIVLFISVISMIGVQMTSFIAILGAAGLAVGLALQGSMANFAGGVLIMLFRPYKVGDLIEAQGFLGVVKEIQIFNTILNTVDNKTIIIPNGSLSNGNITNYSTEATRRVDLVFGISYGDDIKKTRDVLTEIIKGDNRILTDPAPQIRLLELGDSSVNFAVRVWCNGADYWDVFFDMNEKVKLEFDKNKISIPFPQRDVHLYQH